jgi:hypothetical protein
VPSSVGASSDPSVSGSSTGVVISSSGWVSSAVSPSVAGASDCAVAVVEAVVSASLFCAVSV